MTFTFSSPNDKNAKFVPSTARYKNLCRVKREKNLSVHRLSTLLRVFQFPVEFRILVPYVHIRCCIRALWGCVCADWRAASVATRKVAFARVRLCVHVYAWRRARVCMCESSRLRARACTTCTRARIRSRDETHWRLSRAGKQPQSKQFARLIDFPWYPRFGVTGSCNALHRPMYGDKRSLASVRAHVRVHVGASNRMLPFDYQTRLRPGRL